MKKADMLYRLPDGFTEDRLHDFINGFTFEPNGFGHQQDDPSACCGDRIIGDFELIYVIGGESAVIVEDREYALKKGDIILIPPFLKHSICTSKTNPHNNYWIHFDVYPFYRQEDFIKAMLPEKHNSIHIGDGERLSQLYGMLEEEMNKREAGYKTFFAALLRQIVAAILRENSRESREVPRSDIDKFPAEKNIVDRSIEFINLNLSRDIRVEDISKSLHVSESYIFKAFERVLKVSPIQFIQFIRMKRAENLIKTTNMSIKEISDLLGFSSPYYFSKVFKKYFGAAPRDYADNINC